MSWVRTGTAAGTDLVARPDLDRPLPPQEAVRGRPARPRPQVGVAITLLASLLMGAGLAYTAIPVVYRHVPSDLSRTGVLLSALASPSARPDIVVFGNSIAMNGVDARLVGSRLPGGPRIYNLSTTGQMNDEPLLYHQELPRSVRTIVHVLDVRILEVGRCMSANAYNAFFMSGFRPSLETKNLVGDACGRGARAMLDASELKQRFRARWVLRQLIDTGIRRLVRGDLDLDRQTTDLYFPTAYRRRIAPEKLEFLFQADFKQRGDGRFSLASSQAKLLRSMAQVADQRGQRVVFVLAPMHPRMRQHYGDGFFEDLRILAWDHDLGRRVEILNATDVLSAEQFVDDLHPTRAGARRLSELIASRIAAR